MQQQGQQAVKPENNETTQPSEESAQKSAAENSENVTPLKEGNDTPPEASTDAEDAKTENSEPELDPVAVLEAELAETKDRLLRQAAEMENLRRRTEREKEDMAKFAITNFARDIVTIDDNLTRTLSAVPEGAVDEDPALKSLVEGVEMTGRELANALERHGIQRIDPKGDIFDPNLHQALFEIPNPEVPAGTILEVVAPGFMIEARILRPAMVGVAKGGEKPKKETKTEQSDENNEEKIDKAV